MATSALAGIIWRINLGLAAPSAKLHKLYVIRLGSDAGIPAPLEIALPQFQVHGMRCRDRAIDVASFDSIYTTTFDESGRVTGRTVTALPQKGQLPDWAMPQRNLARLSRASATLQSERHNLMSASDTRRFVLDISAVASPTSKCETAITTRVLELDARSNEIAGRMIFQGTGHRECGSWVPNQR